MGAWRYFIIQRVQDRALCLDERHSLRYSKIECIMRVCLWRPPVFQYEDLRRRQAGNRPDMEGRNFRPIRALYIRRAECTSHADDNILTHLFQHGIQTGVDSEQYIKLIG